MKMSRALVETSFKALQAAQERDAKKLLNVGGDIDEACENCHVKYRPPGY
jgi:cytochrome c556